MYSKQANSAPFSSTRPSGEAVRLAVGDGRWMTMQQAIIVTGLTERTLRRHIQKGWLKFRRQGKRSNSPLELWVTPEVSKFVDHADQVDSDDSQIVEIFDAAPDDSDEEIIDTSPKSSVNAGSAENQDASAKPSEAENLLRTITTQFLERLDKSNEMLFELRTELQDKDRQLKLLPDLQKQANERELAELKSIALEKQIEELKQINEKLQQEADLAAAKSLLPKEKKSWWQSLFISESSDGPKEMQSGS